MNMHTLDLNFQNVPQAIASYLIVGPEGPVLIETGPNSVRDNLIARLADYGYAPEDIEHIFVTHIHLDHAGAAGWWGQQGATVYVHHVGAPHLIEPEKLWKSATRIYGDDMERLWGEMIPAPAEQVVALHDGNAVEAGGLTFTAIDTPGHAWHHHVFRVGDVGFTGDAAGIHLPHMELIDLPAPPPEFDREAWRETLQKLQKENFARIYPTHFGAIDDPNPHFRALDALIEDTTQFIKEKMEAGVSRDDMVVEYQEWVRQRAADQGISPAVMQRYETANPLFMTVDGIMRYWRKKEE
jgi:glyoxylase-like metal-dependent hydrolase (beta-lactamase superfamily II)